MNYFDFYKLSYKKFKRSPYFSKKLILKILSIIAYIFLFLYMIGFAVLAYYGIKEEFPEADVFKKGNDYLFIYFFIVLYLVFNINFDSMNVKPFLIWPVPKKKIIHFHLFQVFNHPANLALLLMLGVYLFLIGQENYSIPGLLAWFTAVISTAYILNYFMFFSDKSQWWNIIMSLLIFLIIIKIKVLAVILRPVGTVYYDIYQHPYLALIPLFLLAVIYIFLYRYLSTRLYIDNAIKAKKGSNKINDFSLPGIEKYGLMGSFIRNDIRLIWRNARPRQFLPGVVMFFLMAAFMYSDLGTQTHQPEFYKIMFSMFITGYFVVQFGNFIPAWDSEYYSLLMTQGINYRQYIEAKWWLLVVSVLVLSVFTIPFIYFGWKVLLLIWVMAVFNIGINIPLVLLTGVFNTQPIKLNKKVKAFQSNNHFKFKTFMIALLRLIIPIGIYLLIEKYAGFTYATGSFFAMGLLGLIYKNIILNKISKLYIQRKYKTLRAFKADE